MGKYPIKGKIIIKRKTLIFSKRQLAVDRLSIITALKWTIFVALCLFFLKNLTRSKTRGWVSKEMLLAFISTLVCTHYIVILSHLIRHAVYKNLQSIHDKGIFYTFLYFLISN